MKIPELKKSSRNREYKLYTPEQHFEVVKGYIFDGLSHRQIDEEILDLDSEYSRGYQAMGILHYLGITGAFKGLFKDFLIEDAILELKNKADASYDDLIAILSRTEGYEMQNKKAIHGMKRKRQVLMEG